MKNVIEFQIERISTEKVTSVLRVGRREGIRQTRGEKRNYIVKHGVLEGVGRRGRRLGVRGEGNWSHSSGTKNIYVQVISILTSQTQTLSE